MLISIFVVKQVFHKLHRSFYSLINYPSEFQTNQYLAFQSVIHQEILSNFSYSVFEWKWLLAWIETRVTLKWYLFLSDSCKFSIWQTQHYLNISTSRNNQHGSFFPLPQKWSTHIKNLKTVVLEKERQYLSLVNVKVRGINDLSEYRWHLKLWLRSSYSQERLTTFKIWSWNEDMLHSAYKSQVCELI